MEKTSHVNNVVDTQNERRYSWVMEAAHMATRGKMTDMEKSKRADRRESKQNAPCPHDWEDVDGTGALHACRICPTVTDGKKTWVGA